MSRFNREAHDLQLHRNARSGDKNAQRELEMRDTYAAASETLSGLRDRALKGDAQAMSSLRQLASGTAPSAPAQAASTGVTQATVTAARSAATKAERERWAQVFASDASKGRERGCVGILSADNGWSASSICAELPHLPKDGAIASTANRAASDAVWDKAHGKTGQVDPDAGKPVASDPWAKAYARASK